MTSDTPSRHLRWGFACGVASLGVLRALGDGVAPEKTAHALYGGLGARIGGEAHFHFHRALYLRGYVEGVGTLTKIALRVAGNEVWRTRAAALSIGIGPLGEIS